jgi:ribosomal protein RSM22 (predicted rRNA methylase)
MDLPQALRQTVEALLESTPLSELTKAAEKLSRGYRSETKEGQFHLNNDLAAKAYLVTRLPATFAAVSACLGAVAEVKSELFAPKTLLDVGAGPGTVMWAASERWPSLDRATLLEASPSIRAWGEKLGSPIPEITWLNTDIRTPFEATASDLVTAAYVLNELEERSQETLIHRLWELTNDVLLIVEPGTPAGYKRILRARAQLLQVGAHIVAPCPHDGVCPLSNTSSDWCHFSQRVARSKLHRQAKNAEVGWEDEKYSYIAVSRTPGSQVYARVLGTPKARSGLVQLELCKQDGTAQTQTISKRNGEFFKKARRVDWGGTL